MVRLSFGGAFTEPVSLHADVMVQLDGLARDREIPVRYDTVAARFRHLRQALHGQTGQRVAVLVDEYDKPILDALALGAPVLFRTDDHDRCFGAGEGRQRPLRDAASGEVRSLAAPYRVAT